MTTNAELNKEVKDLKEAVTKILEDFSKYSTVSMSDAKDYLGKLNGK